MSPRRIRFELQIQTSAASVLRQPRFFDSQRAIARRSEHGLDDNACNDVSRSANRTAFCFVGVHRRQQEHLNRGHKKRSFVNHRAEQARQCRLPIVHKSSIFLAVRADHTRPLVPVRAIANEDNTFRSERAASKARFPRSSKMSLSFFTTRFQCRFCLAEEDS